MSATPEVPANLPTLAEIGYDLLTTTPFQCFISLIRPFICVGLYALFATLGRWPSWR